MSRAFEEAYSYHRMPNERNTTLGLLGEAGRTQLENERFLAEENAKAARTPYDAITNAFEKGVQQYDKSYDRAYGAEQDKIANARRDREEGRADKRLGFEEGRHQREGEMHGRNLEAADTQNAGAKIALQKSQQEQAFRDAVDPNTGRSRYETGMQSVYDWDMGANQRNQAMHDVGLEGARAGVQLTRSQIKNNLDATTQGKEDRLITAASEELRGAIARGDQNAVAEIKAAYSSQGLTPSGMRRAEGRAQQAITESSMIANINQRGSPEGAAANQAAAKLDSDTDALQNLVMAQQEYKKHGGGTDENRAALDRIYAAMDVLDPTRVGGLEGGPMGLSVDTGGPSTREARIERAVASVEQKLESQLATLQSQTRGMPGTEVQGQIARIQQKLAQVKQMRMGMTRNGVPLIGGAQGPAALNANFLRGGGMGAPPPPQHGQVQPASAQPGQGQAPMMPSPSLRHRAVSTPQPAVGVQPR